ncbi:MAG: hypothetical protein KBA97_07690 [Methanothrix sp.]|nr:hypothetical protein [Methanothrix sp.]
MKGIYLLLIFYLFISFSSANSCGDCEIHWANLTNIGFVNASSGLGRPVGPLDAYESVNVSYCGCPDLNNTVVANASDPFGNSLGPKVVYQKVNLTYFADLDITKIPRLVTNMTEVGPDLVLVEYNITVTNIGQVNITGLWVYDPRLGNYSLGKLLPGDDVTIEPYPYYAITPNDVQYCSIDNMAVVNGTDRCCKGVDAAAYANVPLGAMNLETYLKIYAKQLIEYGYDLKEEGDAEDLAEYEEMIRIQANRLMVLHEAMEGDVTSCVRPEPFDSSEYNFSRCAGCASCH